MLSLRFTRTTMFVHESEHGRQAMTVFGASGSGPTTTPQRTWFPTQDSLNLHCSRKAEWAMVVGTAAWTIAMMLFNINLWGRITGVSEHCIEHREYSSRAKYALSGAAWALWSVSFALYLLVACWMVEVRDVLRYLIFTRRCNWYESCLVVVGTIASAVAGNVSHTTNTNPGIGLAPVFFIALPIMDLLMLGMRRAFATVLVVCLALGFAGVMIAGRFTCDSQGSTTTGSLAARIEDAVWVVLISETCRRFAMKCWRPWLPTFVVLSTQRARFSAPTVRNVFQQQH